MLDDIENELIVELENEIEGVKIDRKRYAVAIHYRNAPEASIDTVFKKAGEIIQKYKDFKKGTGKKIIEIKPGIDWHKGKALFWIMDALDVENKNNYIPIYIGDDVTDEDAFKAIADEGIGILVGEHELPTAAKCKLKGVEEVKLLLLSLAKTY
jgi:trehalose-phosphatase